MNEHASTASAQNRRRAIYSSKVCAFCGECFSPATSKPKTCSWQCRFLLLQRDFEGKEGCWEWPQSRNIVTGYGQFHAEEGGKRNQTAHRLSFLLNKGGIPDDRLVMHSCDNRGCFNPAHLSLGTHLDNCHDKINKGRQKEPKRRKLEDHHNSKLTLAAIAEIRSCKGRVREFAKKYGVSTSCINDARAGVSWSTAPQFCGPHLPIALSRRLNRAKTEQLA